MAQSIAFVIPGDPSHVQVKADVLAGPEEHRKIWAEYQSGGDWRPDPRTDYLMPRASARVTAVRRQMVDDRTWYGCEFFNDINRPMHVDDTMYVNTPLPHLGFTTGFGVMRDISDRPFSGRDQAIAELIGDEFLRLWSAPDLADPREAVLSPREKQVVNLLRGPLSEKEIARQLHLSPHTTHNYVTSVYKKYNVSGRAEFMHHAATRPRPLRPEIVEHRFKVEPGTTGSTPKKRNEI